MTFDPAAPNDSYERVYNAVRAWVAKGTGITDVTWSFEPQANISPVTKARVNLQEMSFVDSGTDELRRSYNEATDKQTVSQVGIRLLVVQVKIESLQRMPTAFVLMERLRQHTQGSRRSHVKELRDANISLNELGKATNLPTTYDNRVFTVCAAELTLNVGSVIPGVEEDFVDTVNFDGDIT